jgi:hypothetical protein
VATDNCGDVKVSSVRSDGAAIDSPYPVGLTTITWTATDAAGNTASATQTVTVLDVEPPVFVGASTFGRTVQSLIRVNATSPLGAVVTYDVPATDNVKVTSLSCEPMSGSMFPVGTSQVACTAGDAAGNTASKSFSVTVVGAQEQLDYLMATMKDQFNLRNGTAQPLINQLKSASRENGNECKKMTDFIDMVSKKGSNINPQDAEMMVLSAIDIMGAMGCESGTTVPTAATISIGRLPAR